MKPVSASSSSYELDMQNLARLRTRLLMDNRVEKEELTPLLECLDKVMVGIRHFIDE